MGCLELNQSQQSSSPCLGLSANRGICRPSLLAAAGGYHLWRLVVTCEDSDSVDRYVRAHTNNSDKLRLNESSSCTSAASRAEVKVKLTSRMILTASRVFPSFRAHIANRRLTYTRMLVSRPVIYSHTATRSSTSYGKYYTKLSAN